MLVGLRTRVDAVMIGAGTMRAERYGRVVGDPAKRQRREREGLPHDPLVVIVSGGLDLPWDAPLFHPQSPSRSGRPAERERWSRLRRWRAVDATNAAGPSNWNRQNGGYKSKNTSGREHVVTRIQRRETPLNATLNRSTVARSTVVSVC